MEEEELLMVCFFSVVRQASSLFSGDEGWRGNDVDADAGGTYSSPFPPPLSRSLSLCLTPPPPPPPPPLHRLKGVTQAVRAQWRSGGEAD